jgi:hypothetical protein
MRATYNCQLVIRAACTDVYTPPAYESASAQQRTAPPQAQKNKFSNLKHNVIRRPLLVRGHQAVEPLMFLSLSIFYLATLSHLAFFLLLAILSYLAIYP